MPPKRQTKSAPPKLPSGRMAPRKLTTQPGLVNAIPTARGERTRRQTREVPTRLTTMAGPHNPQNIRVHRTIVEAYDGRGKMVRYEFPTQRGDPRKLKAQITEAKEQRQRTLKPPTSNVKIGSKNSAFKKPKPKGGEGASGTS